MTPRQQARVAERRLRRNALSAPFALYRFCRRNRDDLRTLSVAESVFGSLLQARAFHSALMLRDQAKSLDFVFAAEIEPLLTHAEIIALFGLGDFSEGFKLVEGASRRRFSADQWFDIEYEKSRALVRLGESSKAEESFARLAGARNRQARAAGVYHARVVARRDPRIALEILSAVEQAHGKVWQITAMRQHLLHQIGETKDAWSVLRPYMNDRTRGPASDLFLCMANLAFETEDHGTANSYIRSYFDRYAVSAPVNSSATGFHLANLRCKTSHGQEGPLVTVIMTNFQNADYLEYSLGSLMAQDHSHLQIILVDDASADSSNQVIERARAADRRIEVLFNEKNVGPYVSRNRAIKCAKGKYITFHDSDDWHHPQRISRQVAMMECNLGFVGCHSRWVRVTSNGRFVLQGYQLMTSLNPSSLLVRRNVFRDVGYFDSVRIGADSEFIARLQMVYGPKRLALLREPLAFGLAREDSLTRTEHGKIDPDGMSPTRRAYREAWVRWQRGLLMEKKRPKLSFPLVERPFPVPKLILPTSG